MTGKADHVAPAGPRGAGLSARVLRRAARWIDPVKNSVLRRMLEGADANEVHGTLVGSGVLPRVLQQADVAQVVTTLVRAGAFERILREGGTVPLAAALLRAGLLQHVAQEGDVAQFTTALAQSGMFERIVAEGDVASLTTALLNAGWLQQIAAGGDVAEFAAALIGSDLLKRCLEHADAPTLMAELGRSRLLERVANSTGVAHLAQDLLDSRVLQQMTAPQRRAIAAAAAEPPDAAQHEPSPSLLTQQQVAHGHWVAANGDQTLRQEYAIAPGEVVIDLGGYQGQWASDIYARYRPRLFVFEPVPAFAQQIRRRFGGNEDIQVVEAAVASADGHMQIGLAADASSSFGGREDMVDVAVLDFVAWWRSVGFAEIALLKINIEGGEYELLEHLISTGAVRKVRDIQVQFHNFVPAAEERMAAIQEKLAATHERTYEFKWIWENWRRVAAAEGRP